MLGLAGDKYFIKIISDIIWAINNWLYADEPVYLDKLFENDSYDIIPCDIDNSKTLF